MRTQVASLLDPTSRLSRAPLLLNLMCARAVEALTRAQREKRLKLTQRDASMKFVSPHILIAFSTYSRVNLPRLTRILRLRFESTSTTFLTLVKPNRVKSPPAGPLHPKPRPNPGQVQAPGCCRSLFLARATRT